jgi:hypothetical protein
LSKFFPSISYPNLKNKEFRNFIEHFDDELDSWDEKSEHHNIVMGSIGMNKDNMTGNVTIWDSFDPHTFSITYYHEKKGSETADLKGMYDEIVTLHREIPKALVEIENAPSGHFDFSLEM